MKKIKPYLLHLFLLYAGITLALIDLSIEQVAGLMPLVFFAYLGGSRYSDPIVIFFFDADEDLNVEGICASIEDMEGQPVEPVFISSSDFIEENNEEM